MIRPETVSSLQADIAQAEGFIALHARLAGMCLCFEDIERHRYEATLDAIRLNSLRQRLAALEAANTIAA